MTRGRARAARSFGKSSTVGRIWLPPVRRARQHAVSPLDPKRRSPPMRTASSLASCLVLAFAAARIMAAEQPTTPAASPAEPKWAMNATIIEACSCPMFCQCYFDTKPAAHSKDVPHGGGEHFCKFNNAYKVNKGEYGGV